jgi:alkanesulfonate monooxygenase SsuD/methylene tetrahydromethanopterin reductase-like flavin-dependent oxidoreductase (luciferase family)
VQKPWPPILVGGETPAALRRAAHAGDGWIGLGHTPESVVTPVATIERLREDAGRGGERFEMTVGGAVETADDVKRWEEAGVHRLIVSPWPRSPQAVEGIRRFAETHFG